VCESAAGHYVAAVRGRGGRFGRHRAAVSLTQPREFVQPGRAMSIAGIAARSTVD
jgi:hypothetical protein